MNHAQELTVLVAAILHANDKAQGKERSVEDAVQEARGFVAFAERSRENLGTPYKVVSLDLTQARDAAPIEATVQRVVRAITAVTWPAGALARIRIGDKSAEDIPIRAEGAAFDLSDYPTNRGIFISHAAQPGVTVELLFGYEP